MLHFDDSSNSQKAKDHLFQIEIQDNVISVNMYVNYVLFISLTDKCRCVGGRVGGKEQSSRDKC